MADRDFGAHLVDEIIQIGAVIHVREERTVHLFHLGPVGAVRVRHVEVVALIAPCLVEDLLELLLEVDVRAKIGVDATSRRRRLTIGVDDEHGGAAASCRTAATAASSSTTACAVDELWPSRLMS